MICPLGFPRRGGSRHPSRNQGRVQQTALCTSAPSSTLQAISLVFPTHLLSLSSLILPFMSSELAPACPRAYPTGACLWVCLAPSDPHQRPSGERGWVISWQVPWEKKGEEAEEEEATDGLGEAMVSAVRSLLRAEHHLLSPLLSSSAPNTSTKGPRQRNIDL